MVQEDLRSKTTCKIVRHRFPYVFFILILLIAVTTKSNAQQHLLHDNDPRLAYLPYYSFGKGVGITSPDSLFQFNIRFRMQNRAGLILNDGSKPGFDGQVRRLRLRFDGYVGNPHFQYVLQLSFAPGDVGEIQEGENLNIIRDAAVNFRINKHFNLVFGQTKLPGNRQRVISSGALQLTDRTINNARFNIDRDFGFQAFYLHENINTFSFNIKTAVSTGEGRNFTKDPDNGLAYTAKIELMPLGSFIKDGAYFEGDIKREPKPRVFLSAVYHINQNARRTQGQLGSYLYEERTMANVFVDALLKYRGFNLALAYMQRTCKNPFTISPSNENLISYVYTGYGYDVQSSYLFIRNIECIGRFSMLRPDAMIQSLTPDVNEYCIGITRYVWEHAFKIQLEQSLNQLMYYNGSIKYNWVSRLQVEIGI